MSSATSRRRVGGWALLVAGVLTVHACVSVGMADRMGELATDAAMPPRVEVAYVKQMELSAPPPVAAAAAPAPAPAEPGVAAASRQRQRAPKPAPPASAASAPDETLVALVAPAPATLPAGLGSPGTEAMPADPGPAAGSADPASAAEPADPASASRSGDRAPSAAGADPALAAGPDGAAPSTGRARAAPAATAASGAGAAFEWPASTRVSYHLTGNYRGAVDGTAQVEWIRVGARYQVHVDFVVGPSFAPVITQRSSSDGTIGPDGLVPSRYDQQAKVLGLQRPLQTIRFDPSGITFANGERGVAPPHVQDSASQFIQLTYLFSTRPELLVVGGSVDIPLALPKKVDVWTYDVTEQVALQTPLGEIEGLHLVPRGPTKPGSLRVEMWFAPQLRYFPARLRIEQNEGTWVDLVIEKPPEMAR